MLADEREKVMESEKLMVKNAIEKGITKQIRIHARNIVCMRQEVANFIALILCTVLSLISSIIESIDSALATGNSKKMLKTMDQIETQFFNKELVAKFKSSSGTENTPISMSEDEETTVHNEDKEVQKVNEDDVEVKIKNFSCCFHIFTHWSH
ncbi:hypothetical protein MKX01_000994 [Papaver californicum]|nr:hypothetical protein MKX01_000994 [Papaver californicum]